MRPRFPFPASLALALALLAGAQAGASAWPREPGAAFLSLKAESGAAGPASASFYGEYGLTPRVTLTGQLSRDGDGDATRLGGALRYALSAPDAVHRFAVSLGGSAPPSALGAAMEAQAEAALHWGRGFSTRYGDGWATATARVMLARDEARPIADVYGLIGLRPAEGWMAMLSASRYADGEGVTYKLAPSAGYRLREGVWIVPSLTRDLSARATSLGVALWLDF